METKKKLTIENGTVFCDEKKTEADAQKLTDVQLSSTYNSIENEKKEPSQGEREGMDFSQTQKEKKHGVRNKVKRTIFISLSLIILFCVGIAVYNSSSV